MTWISSKDDWLLRVVNTKLAAASVIESVAFAETFKGANTDKTLLRHKLLEQGFIF